MKMYIRKVDCTSDVVRFIENLLYNTSLLVSVENNGIEFIIKYAAYGEVAL